MTQVQWQIYVINIITEAIKKLNKLRGTKIKLGETSFGLTTDKDRPDSMVTLVSVKITNTKTKLSERRGYYEEFFDISRANKDDGGAGVNRVKSDKDKLILRLAYNIWQYSPVARIRRA